MLLTMLVTSCVGLNTYAAKLNVHIINSDVGYGDRESHFSEVQNLWAKVLQNPQYFVFPDYNGDGGTAKRFSMKMPIQINVSLNGKYMSQRTLLPEVGKITTLEFPYAEPSSFNDRINFIIEGEGYLECRFDKIGNLAPMSNVQCESLGSGLVPLWSAYIEHYGSLEIYNAYIYVKYPHNGNQLRTFFGISPKS